MSQPDTPPSTGLVAGKYELVGIIGRGGMGSVWEARHASLGTRFAIKFIEAEYADSHEARSRFDKEARAAATIQSKHAIQIYDHGVTDDGKPYIVMELLQGEPLDKRIDRVQRLSLQETARIIQQVCRGLARAHDQGIIHRDLKPENIFLVRTPDDDEEVAKVLDFGIAKIQTGPGNAAVTSSTKTGAVLGTPFFMSPEQARGLRNVDHRTDLWSLGVIAFKCVTGRLPFDGESVGDLLVKICTAPIPMPSQVAPGLPSSFDAWFARALDREPDRRFATAHELAEALMFAAGLTPRGSSQSSPALIPFPGSGGMPAAGPAPFAGTAPPYAPTPNPGAMTAAPFTSSQPVPGTGGAKWKWLVGAAVAGLVVAGIGTGITVTMRARATDTDAVGITPPPPVEATAASSVLPPVPATPLTETAAEKAASPDVERAVDETAATAEPKKEPRKPAAKVTKKPATRPVKKVEKRPTTTPTTKPTAAKTATPAHTTTAPKKKIDKYESGY